MVLVPSFSVTASRASTTTDTGYEEAKKRFTGIPVFLWPLDFSWAVKRSIATVRPTLLILAGQAFAAGDEIQVFPPQGRFHVPLDPSTGRHYVGIAAGSGITPILSIIASSLEEQPGTKFTLVYGNRRMDSVMFNEALQDLKDQYPDRLTLIHILSRQAQEVDLLEGRIDGDKVRAIMKAFLPVKSMDEVFICGPEAMIEATEQALVQAGVPAERIRTERFVTPGSPAPRGTATARATESAQTAPVRLTVVLDGATQVMHQAGIVTTARLAVRGGGVQASVRGANVMCVHSSPLGEMRARA